MRAAGFRTSLKTEFEQLGLTHQSATDTFGWQCLPARRLTEAGVRYVPANYADLGATPRWEQHSGIQRHETHAKATDQPVTGLLADLKRRGLPKNTLVWWGGEFGRTPIPDYS